MKLDNEHSKQQPFGVPDGYFESFQDTLDARLAEERLREHVADSGFKVPDGYFEQIDVPVVKSIKETPVISLWSRQNLMRIAAVAACAILVFSLFNYYGTETEESYAFEDLSYESIESYLDSGAIELTDQDLTALLSDADIEFTDDSLEEEITNEALESYILDTMDSSDLYTEYEE